MSVAEYAAVMLKGLGAAILTYICSSVCRECGKPTLADYVEFAGRAELVLLCLPLISQIMQAAQTLLDLR